MRKPIILKLALTGLVACGLVGADQVKPAASTQTTQFISTLSTPVKTVANQYKLYPSVMMAQAALESGWGTSQLSTSANNYFGVKGSYNGQSVTMSTAEYDANGQLYYTNAAFKKYPSVQESMVDNAQLLRNGTAWDSSYYSGTWRENAATYQDAANALTGKYATAPTYGTSLINLIQTYGLSTLDSGGSVASESSTADSSSANSSSTATTPTTPTTGATNTTSTTKSKKITYTTGENGQSVVLGSRFRNYAIYNHVKGSAYKTTKYSWYTIGGWTNRPVWLDGRAYKSATKTNWYRIRFSKQTTAKKYWVYKKALTFPKTTYSKLETSATIGSTSETVYNHVYNSAYLAKKLTTTDALKNQKVTVNEKATHVQSGITTTWYRFSAGDVTGWVKASAFSKVG
ncbi:glucosaminidase domain-containing protein [Secundilactobacillus muriivasis]